MALSSSLRSALSLLLTGVALSTLAGSAPPARADLVWEPVGPVPASVGMTAAASDPMDPRVLWMASGSSVWVSDDAGDSFSLVLQTSRAAAITREVGGGEAVEAVPDTPETTSEDFDPEDPDQVDQSSDIDPATGEVIADDAEAAQVGTADADDAADAALEGPSLDSEDGAGVFGVTRLRLVGDELFVCTGRGLWVVDRSARRLGTGRELRFGRRLAVNDVGRDGGGVLYVGTDTGLYAVGAGEVGRRVSGFDAATVVTAITQTQGRLVVASSEGVRVQRGRGFERLGVFGAQEGLIDLVTLTPTRLAAVTDDRVSIVNIEPGRVPFIEQTWTVPGARRVARGRLGTLWAVGRRGVWGYTEDGGWARRGVGLMDRRLADVAPSDDGPAHLYVVGRAGTARLVAETTRIWSKRAKFQARMALEGLPTAEQTVGWATDARGISLEDADSWALEESLAWLLPRVYLRWQVNRARDEESLYIPALDRRILDAVEVWPKDDLLRVEARWNLMPAIYLALNGSSPRIRSARSRARRAQARVRDAVAPLYQTWANKRIRLLATEYESTREVARELLAVQRLEADLYVYTGGKFPILGVTEWTRPPTEPRPSPDTAP